MLLPGPPCHLPQRQAGCGLPGRGAHFSGAGAAAQRPRRWGPPPPACSVAGTNSSRERCTLGRQPAAAAAASLASHMRVCREPAAASACRQLPPSACAEPACAGPPARPRQGARAPARRTGSTPRRPLRRCRPPRCPRSSAPTWRQWCCRWAGPGRAGPGRVRAVGAAAACCCWCCTPDAPATPIGMPLLGRPSCWRPFGGGRLRQQQNARVFLSSWPTLVLRLRPGKAARPPLPDPRCPRPCPIQPAPPLPPSLPRPAPAPPCSSRRWALRMCWGLTSWTRRPALHCCARWSCCWRWARSTRELATSRRPRVGWAALGHRSLLTGRGPGFSSVLYSQPAAGRSAAGPLAAPHPICQPVAALGALLHRRGASAGPPREGAHRPPLRARGPCRPADGAAAGGPHAGQGAAGERRDGVRQGGHGGGGHGLHRRCLPHAAVRGRAGSAGRGE